MVFAARIYFILSNNLFPCHDRQEPAISRYEGAYHLRSTFHFRAERRKQNNTEKHATEG